MKRSTGIALAAALPGAAAMVFRAYRQSVAELDGSLVAPPDLPGRVRVIATRWGRVSYRHIDGSPDLPPLVLVHGWGRTADTSWWPLYSRVDNPILAVDLPGHGRSMVDHPFTFRLAAEAISVAVHDAGVDRPLLVGHSMGGAVGLATIRRTGAAPWRGFVAVATSASWARPRSRVTVAAAPYVLFPRSPFVIRAQRNDTRRSPDQAPRIAWEYAVRPSRQVLAEAAMELSHFDALRWPELELPPTTWVVTTEDGIVDPDEQRRSAEALGARIVEIPVDHSVQVNAPDLLARILQAVSDRPAGPIMVAV